MDENQISLNQADAYDVYVDARSGKCLPYPCPFAIKIYFSNFEDAELYNGYYVINPPATFLGKKIRRLGTHIMSVRLWNFKDGGS